MATKLPEQTSSSYTITNAHATDQATYSVQIINAGGTVTSSDATLTVLIPPTITTQPQSQTVVQGQNATFSVAASGTTPLSYQWNLNGALLVRRHQFIADAHQCSDDTSRQLHGGGDQQCRLR